MKYKTTKTAVLENYNDNTIKIGYCQAQSLLNYENESAYTCGVYGWNADIYEINGVGIITGYRPFGIQCDYELLKEYEKKASDLYSSYENYEERKEESRKLLLEYVKKELSGRKSKLEESKDE